MFEQNGSQIQGISKMDPDLRSKDWAQIPDQDPHHWTKLVKKMALQRMYNERRVRVHLIKTHA